MGLERSEKPTVKPASASAIGFGSATLSSFQQVRRLHAQFELAEGHGGGAAPAALGQERREGLRGAALAATTPGQPRRKSRRALNRRARVLQTATRALHPNQETANNTRFASLLQIRASGSVRIASVPKSAFRYDENCRNQARTQPHAAR